MAQLKNQFIGNEGNGIILVNQFNNEALLKENYEERKGVGKGSGSAFRPVCSIDVPFLQQDPKGLGQKVLEARSGTPEFRIALRLFLAEYPEYRTSDTRI